MLLKEIKYKKAYEDVIASKIVVCMWVNIFQQCFQILKSNEVLNDSDIIREAIVSGKIVYDNGLFTGKFNNSIATELEKLGAKYSKYRKGYLLSKDKLPVEILWAIDTAKATAYTKAMAINQFLLSQLSNLGDLIKKLVFDEAVNAIMKNLQERVYKNAKQHKIELITPKLDSFMEDEIAKRYTENLNFWIKNWTEDQIVKMRNEVSVMANVGKSTKTISDYIQKEFGISQSHAKFLARNESAIATSSYLSAKYEAEGFSSFKWHTIMDGRERDLHKQLNGQIFRFDNPPIIDERTGQKGLPGQTYNCRCTFSPIIDGEFLRNRKQMFKANNSLLEKIKNCLNLKRKTA